MSGSIIKEGFLVKSPPLEKTLSSWKRRYFRLWESGRLDYFETSKEKEQAMRSINLLDAQEITCPSKREFDRAHCIKITTKERTFVLQCSDDNDKRSWHDKISAMTAVATGQTLNGTGDTGTLTPKDARQSMPLPDLPPVSSPAMLDPGPDPKLPGAPTNLASPGPKSGRQNMPLPTVPPMGGQAPVMSPPMGGQTPGMSPMGGQAPGMPPMGGQTPGMPPMGGQPPVPGQGRPPPVPTASRPTTAGKPYTPPGGQPLPIRDLKAATISPRGSAKPPVRGSDSGSFSGPALPPRPASTALDGKIHPLTGMRQLPHAETDKNPPTGPALPPRPGVGGLPLPPGDSEPPPGPAPRRQAGYTLVDFSQTSHAPPAAGRGVTAFQPQPPAPGAPRTAYTQIDLRKTEEFRQNFQRPEDHQQNHCPLSETRQDSVGYVQMLHPSQVRSDSEEKEPFDYERMNLSGPPPQPGFPHVKPSDSPPVPRRNPPKPLPREKSIRRTSKDEPPALPSRRT